MIEKGLFKRYKPTWMEYQERRRQQFCRQERWVGGNFLVELRKYSPKPESGRSVYYATYVIKSSKNLGGIQCQVPPLKFCLWHFRITRSSKLPFPHPDHKDWSLASEETRREGPRTRGCGANHGNAGKLSKCLHTGCWSPQAFSNI